MFVQIIMFLLYEKNLSGNQFGRLLHKIPETNLDHVHIHINIIIVYNRLKNRVVL